MTGRPQAAIDAAAIALHDADCGDTHCEPTAMGVYYARAQRALEAAEPHLAADLAARLRAETVDGFTAICTETVLEAVAAERQRWAAKFREMAAVMLPRVGPGGISFAELQAQNPNSPMQAQGRLLLDLANLLDKPLRDEPQPTSTSTHGQP